MTHIDLDDGQIRLAVATDELRLMLGFVVEPNHNFRGLLDDMMIGHNVAAFIHDKTGTEVSRFIVAILIVRPTAKEIKEIEWIRGIPVPVRIG